jgi:hypothetical protein
MVGNAGTQNKHESLLCGLGPTGNAMQAQFVYMDDLSHVWCQWAEMEVKHRNYRRAIDLLARAVTPPATATQTLTPEQLKVRF